MIEKLYCKIMQDMDYEVPFTLEELLICIKNYPKVNIENSIKTLMIM